MVFDPRDFMGRMTFISGPGKGCGKTTFLNAALNGLRRAGEKPAFLGIGFDGDRRDTLTGGSRPGIRAMSGEILVTAERYLRATSCRFEILDLVPGSTAVGRLVIARVVRDGDVTLVGPEGNETVAWVMDRMRRDFGAHTVIVDGAMSRITQVSAFPDARFVFVLRVEAGDLQKQVKAMRRLHDLVSLPQWGGAGATSDAGAAEASANDATAVTATGAVLRISGPLTPRRAELIGAEAGTVVVDDFTKVFLDAAELAFFRRSHPLEVANPVDFGGFVVILRNVGRPDFLGALGRPDLDSMICFNPFEVSTEGARA